MEKIWKILNSIIKFSWGKIIPAKNFNYPYFIFRIHTSASGSIAFNKQILKHVMRRELRGLRAGDKGNCQSPGESMFARALVLFSTERHTVLLEIGDV